MLFLLLFFWTLVLAPLTAFMAGQRGYDVMHWYLYGLVLGPMGLLAGLLPKRSHEPDTLFA